MEIYFANKVSLYLIELSLCNSPNCNMKITGHWSRYSTTPNVQTLSTQSSQAINLALKFLLQHLPGQWLCSNSDNKQVFTPICQSSSIKMGQLLQQKRTYVIPRQIWPQMCSKTLTTATKLGVTLLRESQQWFGASYYGIQSIIVCFTHFWTLVTFQYKGCPICIYTVLKPL